MAGERGLPRLFVYAGKVGCVHVFLRALYQRAEDKVGASAEVYKVMIKDNRIVPGDRVLVFNLDPGANVVTPLSSLM